MPSMSTKLAYTVSVIRKFPFRISFTIVERSSNDCCGTVAKSYLKYDCKMIVKRLSVHVRGFQVNTARGLARSWEAATIVSTMCGS